jgi:hypothetical protein
MGGRTRVPTPSQHRQPPVQKPAESTEATHGNQANLEDMSTEEESAPLDTCKLDAALGAVPQPTPPPVEPVDPVEPAAGPVDARKSEGQKRVEAPAIDAGGENVGGSSGSGLAFSAEGGQDQGFQAAAMTTAVTTDIPEIGVAWAQFAGHATEVRGRIEAAVVTQQDVLRASAMAASNAVLTTSAVLASQVSTAFETTRSQIRTSASLTRDNLTVALEARKQELHVVNAEQAARVTESAQAHHAEISALVAELATHARGHGVQLKADLAAETTNHAAQATAAGATVASTWSSHDRSHDIGVTVRRMAAKASESFTGQIGADSHVLAQDGEDLAVKIEEDGAAFLENLTVDGTLGGDSIDTSYEVMLADAEAAMDEAHASTLVTVSQTEADGIAQVDQAELSVNDQMDLMVDGQLAGIDLALQQGLLGLTGAGDLAVEAFDTQIADIEEFASSADPTQWPAVIAELLRLMGTLDTSADAFEASFAEMGGRAAIALTAAGDACVSDLQDVAGGLQEHLNEIVTGVNEGLTKAEQDFDVALGEQVQSCTEAWTADADDKILTLDGARDEARDALQETSRVGIEQMDTKYNDAVTQMSESLGGLRTDLNGKADEIANQSSWDRFWSGVGNFFLGIWDAVVDFVKVILIVALVVLAIVVLVLIVAALIGGAAAIGAILTAVATFVAAAATVIFWIGVVLTVIGVIFAIVSVVSAWMDPNLTSDERWRATGKGVGDIALEFIPDWGIGFLTRADDAADTARIVENVGDVITHADELVETGQAVENVTNAASSVDELSDLNRAADVLGSHMDEAEDALRGIDEGIDAAQEVVPTRTPIETPTTTPDAPAVVPDAPTVSPSGPAPGSQAHFDSAVDGGYGGTLETWQRKVGEGFRFDPNSRRWRRPDNVSTWNSWEAARGRGYSGTFDTWQSKVDDGLQFNFGTRRWRRPVPDASVPTPDAPTVAVTPDAPVITPATPAATPDVPVSGGTQDPQATTWLEQYRRVQEAYRRADDGSLPALQTTYDYFKGVAMSAYQVVMGTGSFVDGTGTIANYFQTNDPAADAIEAADAGQ